MEIPNYLKSILGVFCAAAYIVAIFFAPLDKICGTVEKELTPKPVSGWGYSMTWEETYNSSFVVNMHPPRAKRWTDKLQYLYGMWSSILDFANLQDNVTLTISIGEKNQTFSNIYCLNSAKIVQLLCEFDLEYVLQHTKYVFCVNCI